MAFQIDFFRLAMPSPFYPPSFQTRYPQFQNILDEKDLLFSGQVRTLFLVSFWWKAELHFNNCHVWVFSTVIQKQIKIQRNIIPDVYISFCVLYRFHETACIHEKKMGLSIYSVELRTKKFYSTEYILSCVGGSDLRIFFSWGGTQHLNWEFRLSTVLSWWRRGLFTSEE